MGAYPMDTRPGKPGLAVFEYRGFSQDPKLRAFWKGRTDRGEPLDYTMWPQEVQIFHDNFVPPDTTSVARAGHAAPVAQRLNEAAPARSTELPGDGELGCPVWRSAVR